MKRIALAVVAMGGALLLAACGTEKLYQGERGLAEVSIIRGDLKVPAYDGGQVLLETVDGRAISPNNNRASVVAGQHTIGIRCSIPEKQISATNQITFQVFAARVYKLELRESGNSCRGVVVDLASGQQVAG